jgi:hypothetical protein
LLRRWCHPTKYLSLLNKMINNVEIIEHLIKLIICIYKYKYKYFISTNSSTING